MQNVLLNAPPHAYLIEEVHRKDIYINEQNKKIEMLEMELSRSKQKIDELQTQLSKCNENGYKSAQGRYWSVDEHQRFLEGLKRYGPKDVKSISQHVGTRNATQVRTHAQKYFLRLEKEKGEEQNVNSPNSDEVSSFNNKEKDDDDVQEDGSSDKDPPNNDNNTVNEPRSEDRSPGNTTTTPPTTDSKTSNVKKSPTKPKPPPAKAKKKAKRKASTMSMQLGESSSDAPVKSENFVPFKPAPHLPSAPLTSFLPTYGVMNAHSGAVMTGFGANVALCNKIIAETSETILYNMKHWTPQDYALFVEGLISVQEEKDNHSKCITIRDKFLPQFPLEDVIKCYSLLQNVAMKETQQSMPYYMVSPLPESAVLEMEPKRMRIISPTQEIAHFGSVSPFAITGDTTAIIRNPYSGALPISHVRGYPTVQYNYQVGHSDAFYPPAFPPLLEHSNSGSRLSAHSNDLRLNANEDFDAHY